MGPFILLAILSYVLSTVVDITMVTAITKDLGDCGYKFNGRKLKDYIKLIRNKNDEIIDAFMRVIPFLNIAFSTSDCTMYLQRKNDIFSSLDSIELIEPMTKEEKKKYLDNKSVLYLMSIKKNEEINIPNKGKIAPVHKSSKKRNIFEKAAYDVGFEEIQKVLKDRGFSIDGKPSDEFYSHLLFKNKEDKRILVGIKENEFKSDEEDARELARNICSKVQNLYPITIGFLVRNSMPNVPEEEKKDALTNSLSRLFSMNIMLKQKYGIDLTDEIYEYFSKDYMLILLPLDNERSISIIVKADAFFDEMNKQGCPIILDDINEVNIENITKKMIRNIDPAVSGTIVRKEILELVEKQLEEAGIPFDKAKVHLMVKKENKQ